MSDGDVSVTKVTQTRATTTLRHVLRDILEDHFPGDGEEIFVFVDNRKVALDAPIALTRFASDLEETIDE